MLAINGWRHRPDYKLGTSHGAVGSNKAADRGIKYHRRVFAALGKTPLAGYTLVVEPWLQEINQGRFLQPDSVLLDTETGSAIVVEVKMNWNDGRDEKLINKYLPAVRGAWQLDQVWPLLITGNLRGYAHPALLGLDDIFEAMTWTPGNPTPVLLMP